MAAAPVFTLCLRCSVEAPVSLSPPPGKAQSALIGQRVSASLSLMESLLLLHLLQLETDCNGIYSTTLYREKSPMKAFKQNTT